MENVRQAKDENGNLMINKSSLWARDVSGNQIHFVGSEANSSLVPLHLLHSLYLVPPFGGDFIANSLSDAQFCGGTNSYENSNNDNNNDKSSRHASSSLVDHETSETWSKASSSDNPTKAVIFTPASSFPPVRLLSPFKRKRILVTGGAGFVGSHLVDRLLFLGHDVTVLDNFFSGFKTGLSHWVGHPNFELVRHDVVDPFMLECDEIYHLACPASPAAYQYNSIKTLKTSFLGTMNMLGLAKRVKARFLLASTSEIYGSPEQHPQPETYWGHVNPIGPRACYDEGKRVAEALTFGYHRQDGVDVRVARIFNTFGPRMAPDDGRVVSNFVQQALKGEDLTIYGDGSQTRSMVYIHDLVDGLIALMQSDCTEPVNLGSESEKTIKEWAETVIEIVEHVLTEWDREHPNAAKNRHPRKKSQLKFLPLPADDPPRRRANIERARTKLKWDPKWTFEAGVEELARYFLLHSF